MAYRPSYSEIRTAPAARSRRRCAGLIALAIMTAATLGAQSVPTGVQEYYVLGWEQHIWDMMQRVNLGQPFPGTFADGMNSVVTATASADNQVVYYDHWEDLPDSELDNFPNVDPIMLQASTLVIGDGDITNGDICNFNANIACGTDILTAGDYVNFNSDRGLGAGCTTPGTPERCSVPLNPRSSADIRFDGGDLIETTGGPLTLIHSQYPLTNFIGGSIEILSRQAVEAAGSYSVPIGEDLYIANTPTEPFHYVELELVAFEDTSITVESPGAGSVSFTLARGEHWSSMGFVDESPFPALGLTINAGTKVSTTAPISGLVFTGGDGNWATRLYTLLPDILHSTDYVTTAPGDDPTAGPTTNGTPQDRPANIYILNPDVLTAIDVTITDSSGTYSVNIPPNAMRSMDDLVPGRDIAPNSTVRLTSDHNFWGVTAYDWDTNISDWGHSWLAKKFLTGTYTVSFGPGNQNQPPDASQYGNPVFVAATADRTRVQFDLDNDGTFDQVDLDGDGAADAAPFPDNTYEFDMLSALKVIDPVDNDMTGARIIANKPVGVSWGQDTDRSFYSDQALDTGFTVYPVNQLFLDPALTISKEVDTTAVPTGSVDADRTVTYTLTVKSYGFGPLSNVEVWDLLPQDVYGDTDYVLNSTLITCPNLVQGTGDPSFDDCTGGPGVDCGQLTWDIEGACGVGFTLGTDNTLTVRYQVVIPVAPSGPRQLTNEAHAQAVLGGSVFSPSDTAKVVQTDVTLTKAVDLTTPSAGDLITFTLQVANTSTSIDETDVYISDPIPADTTFEPGSITADGAFTGSGVFDVAQNAVVWNAALFPFSPAPNSTATLSFQVRVNPTVPAGTEIPNRAGYESIETPYFLSNEVEPVVQGPELTALKSIVGDPAFVHPSESVTFQIHIDNTGTAAASNLFISDPFPSNAAYLAETMMWSLNSGPFTALSDTNDGDEGGGADGRAFADRVEFRLASLGTSQDVTLRFRVVVDPGTAGQFLTNQGVYASDETPSTDTNPVQVPIVGTAVINGHVFLDLNGDGNEDPGEPPIPNVDVVVTSQVRPSYTCIPGLAIPDNGYNGSQASMACCPLTVPAGDFGASPLITDLNIDVSATHTYVGDLTIKVFGPGAQFLALLNRPGSTAPDDGTDTPYGDSSNWSGSLITFDDQGGGPSAEIMGSTITGAQSICIADGICGHVPAPDTAPGLLNLAGFNGTDPRGPWSLCMGDSAGGDTGTFTAGTLSILTDDGVTTSQIVTTDSNGDYTAVVNSDSATINVDESDPDFPPAAVLTTANDPQTIVTIPGGTVTAPDTGYQQPEIIFSKTSDTVNNEVSPGQTVTYTLEITNNTLATQTGISLVDPLPADTSYVSGSTQVTGAGASALRVTEYFLGVGTFTGTTYDLTLAQDLVANYFVIVQGSDGDGTANNNRGPDENYAALTRDPFPTGQLTASGAADRIRVERNAAVNSWVGVVTVVECLADCGSKGFSLLDVRRVAHSGAATTGSDTSSTAWADINQVLLMGGFNGAGCTTAEASQNSTKVCHARIFPSGSDQINWTRDPNDVTLTSATSAVMAVEWGSEWNVQRVRVQGNNGGNGADAVGEYNTAPISSVARANTWVWGTGHTAVEGIGDAAEGALITLGDGVNQNPNENLVAVGNEYALLGDDFEVYALSHPDLAVDQRFKADGDTTQLTVDVTVDSAGTQRMALSFNGLNGNGTAYPRPMFSARFTADTTVRLERRRTGQDFPAWVQGIDFSAIAGAPPSGGVPPNLIVPADGYSIPTGETLTVTFQVVSDDPLGVGVTEIVNDATLNTATLGPYQASVTDDVVRAGVVIEYDNAGFDEVGQTVTYAHVVENTGEGDDSYDISLTSVEGWPVQLIDPGTGAVIAADADGDGVWDGGVTVNTGTLAPNETIDYLLRVTIPIGTSAGTAESTALRATSDRNPGRFDIATDETMAVDALEPVIVLPDNSGVGTAGGTAVYTHRVINNTGATATLDLSAARENEPSTWTTTFYWDANGDGVYSPGIDIEITNTQQLADGASQTIFVVVGVPLGVVDFETDVIHLTAALPSDPDNVFGTATDTTTVRPPLIMDLSGGGTRSVDAGDTAYFPGVLRNFTGMPDVMSLAISPSWFFGFDGLDHPTELWVDPDGDGTYTQLAEDLDGDGTWDGDNGFTTTPTAAVPANGQFAYELRRPVDPAQGPSRDPITLTATSANTAEQDSVTATLLLAAATDAMLAYLDATVIDGRVVVEWRTTFEMGTLGFDLRRRDKSDQAYRKINDNFIPGLLTAPQGGTYRFVDSSARPGDTVSYVLVEHDARGTSHAFGPYEMTLSSDADGTKTAALPSDGLSRVVNTSRVRPVVLPESLRKSAGGGQPSGLVKILVRNDGLIRVPADELASALDLPVATVIDRIGSGNLWINDKGIAPVIGIGIFSDGFESGNSACWESGCEQPDVEAAGVAWIAASDAGALYFYGEAIDSPFTRDNVYWVGAGSGTTMEWRNNEPVGLPAAATFAEELHFEEEFWPLTSVITDPEGDFWMWDYFFSNTPGYDVKTFSLMVPDVAQTGGGAQLTLYLQGASVAEIAPNHNIEIRLNGTQVGGTWSWNGDDPRVFQVEFSQALLSSGDNTLEITALAAPGLDYDVFYLDAVELRYDRLYRALGDRLEAMATATSTITVTGFSSDDITVFDLDTASAPVVLEGTEVEAGEDGFDVRFSVDTGTRFLATTAAAAYSAAGLVTDLASDLANPENTGLWVIVPGAGLEDEAEAFAAYRRAQGMSSVVARVEDIYDEFSGGVASPWAIRDFLHHAVEEWQEAPQYVFLAGDSTIDFKNYDGLAENLVPAPFAVTVDGLVPSDNLLADWIGEDGVPEVSIGRLPAQLPTELAAYRLKVEAFEAAAGGWKRHTLWLADDPDLGGEFGDDTEAIIDALPEDSTVQRVFLGDLEYDDAWHETLETMDKGAGLVTFLGHGGLDRFADEGLLVTEDVAEMTNGERTPFISALTCVVGRFDIPDYDTLAEALVLKSGGGAIALWSPAAFSMNKDAKKLGAHHINAIAGGAHPTIGQSVRAALAAYLLNDHDDEDLPRKVILLGDPAIRVDW
ncbi:MAG: C25 family cysteine peptidase [Acidobacteriota bacterium]|nr:C25 family cysteine peptidase [Acidobacteriota bacterium]